MSLLSKKSDEDSPASSSSSIQIREVWNWNLEQEFDIINGIVDDFPYISMDTEFPGVVVHAVGNFKNSQEFHFQTLRENVNMLKLIQLGLTFSDEHGNLPSIPDITATESNHRRFCTWQFNFRDFNVNEDVFLSDSIELLRRSGIDFEKNRRDGIDARRFASFLMPSGIVLNDAVCWVAFHGAYDVGYLLKLLTCKDLPDTQAGLLELIKIFFPKLYDIKHLMKFCHNLHGGLNKVAELLGVKRVGVSHQAGSDSLLTCGVFMKLKEVYFCGALENYEGVLYGLDRDGGGGHSFSSN